MPTISRAKLEAKVEEINIRFNKKFWINNYEKYSINKELYLRVENLANPMTGTEDRLICESLSRKDMWLFLKGLAAGLENANDNRQIEGNV